MNQRKEMSIMQEITASQLIGLSLSVIIILINVFTLLFITGANFYKTKEEIEADDEEQIKYLKNKNKNMNKK